MIKELLQQQKRHIHVRKNQFDNTAAMVYGLNVSLVHLTLFLMSVAFVKWPDTDRAKIFDQEFGDTKSIEDPRMWEMNCTQYAEGMQRWIALIVCIHILCFIINLFREIFETQLGTVGRVMRLVEVIGIGSYCIMIIKAMWFISITDYWNHINDQDPTEDVRECFVNREKLFEMTGTTTSFARIEILIYFSFALTIVFLTARSRCQKAGMDNSDQFEGAYMSYLVNRIIKSLVFRGKKLNRKFRPAGYVDKDRSVWIDGI